MRDYVTIVSGLPRSGTSMMMKMLEAGGMPVLVDDVRRADPQNPNGYYEYERVKQLRTDSAWIAEAVGKAVKVVYRLLYSLPSEYRYRIVVMHRQMEEVVASQDAMLDAQGRDRGTLGAAELAEVFRRELRDTDAWLRGQRNMEVLPVRYNAILASPTGPLAAVDRFLDGGLDVEGMRRVVDAALYRQRRSEDGR